MIWRIGDDVYRGRAVSLPEGIPEAAVLEAITDDGQNGSTDGRIAAECPPADPVHEHVGYIHPEMGLRTRTALARAGRTRGLETPYDDEIAAVRAELDSLSAGEPSPGREIAATEEEATARAEVSALQEEVSAARGRLEACRNHGLETEEAANDLEAAIRELSERRTAAAAASEQRERARMEARKRRDRLERRLRLEDRVANLEREARRFLVDRLEEEFAAALGRVPGASPPADPFAAPAPAAALAIARLASLDAPVVLGTDRFESAEAASEFLDAPVVHV